MLQLLHHSIGPGRGLKGWPIREIHVVRRRVSFGAPRAQPVNRQAVDVHAAGDRASRLVGGVPTDGVASDGIPIAGECANQLAEEIEDFDRCECGSVELEGNRRRRIERVGIILEWKGATTGMGPLTCRVKAPASSVSVVTGRSVYRSNSVTLTPPLPELTAISARCR